MTSLYILSMLSAVMHRISILLSDLTPVIWRNRRYVLWTHNLLRPVEPLSYRRKLRPFMLTLLILCLNYSTAYSDSLRSPWEMAEKGGGESKDKTVSMNLPALTLLRLYQTAIGPIKGQHCPMEPSCSQYSLEAIQRYGLFLGLLMTADRLHRCGHDVSRYSVVDTDAGARYADPIEQNTIEYYRHK